MPASKKNKNNTSASDAVDLTTDEQVRYWLTALSCSYPDLMMAIITVGNSLQAIKGYLDKQSFYKWRKMPTF